MADAQFFGANLQFFEADLLWDCFWPRNYAFFCCWTAFGLKIMHFFAAGLLSPIEIMVLCHVYP